MEFFLLGLLFWVFGAYVKWQWNKALGSDLDFKEYLLLSEEDEDKIPDITEINTVNFAKKQKARRREIRKEHGAARAKPKKGKKQPPSFVAREFVVPPPLPVEEQLMARLKNGEVCTNTKARFEAWAFQDGWYVVCTRDLADYFGASKMVRMDEAQFRAHLQQAAKDSDTHDAMIEFIESPSGRTIDSQLQGEPPVEIEQDNTPQASPVTSVRQ